MSTLPYTIALESPAWLLLLLAAPLLWLVGRRSLADLPRRQVVLQTAVRTLVLTGLALALARPAVRRDVGSVSAVVVIDVSASVTDEALKTEQDLLSSLARAAKERATAGFSPLRAVRFAQHAAELPLPDAEGGALSRFSATSGAGTDVALALGLAAGLVVPDAIPRLLLVSDGAATTGDALSAAERAAARGLTIDVVPLTDQTTGDVAVDGMDAPDEIRPRAPFEVQIRLLSDHAGSARLRLERDGQPNSPDAERTVEISPGLTTVAWPTRIDQPERSVYKVRVVSATRNRHTENDQGVLTLGTEREPRVLYLEGESGASANFVRTLQSQRIEVDVRGPRALPPPRELDRFDAIVMSDVPRAALTDAQLAALEAYVRNGGGLLMTGGANSFGSGGYGGSPLEALLPVRIDVPEKMNDATLALALVIDKSGSMSGPKMDLTKEAARATAEMLPAADQIAVVVFDSQATPVVRMQRAANRMRILGDISRIQASGGTNIHGGLREAVDQLLPVRARKKHIILLSDGQSSYEGITDLVETAASAQITISAVGVGDGADQTLLRLIASRGGGRFYNTRDPASIPRIFSRETSQVGNSSIIEEPTAVRVSKQVEALAGIPLDEAPKLRGYAVTRPRRDAELLLTTETGAPLLARWQIGLGQVTAWTSDVKARWSGDWMRWSAYPKFWAQVMRSTMRRRAPFHFPLAATLAGDTVTVSLDAVGPDDRFVGGLSGKVEITAVGIEGAQGPGRMVALNETAPGSYEARFPVGVAAGGSLLMKATLARGATPVADAAGRLTLPFAPELRPGAPETGRALLTAIAARTGGRVFDGAGPGARLADVPAALFDPGTQRRTRLTPLRTPVLLLTLLFFAADVLLRRLRFKTFDSPR